MRRATLFLVIISIVVSGAVPTGAVFASEGTQDAPNDSPVAQNPEPEDSDDSGDTSDKAKNQAPPEEKPTDEKPVTKPAEKQSVPAKPKALNVPTPQPPVVVQSKATLPTSPLLITAYKANGAHLHAVQVYNNSSKMVPIDDVALLYVAGGSEYEVPLPSGWIKPRSYIVMAWQGESAYADIEFQFGQTGGGAFESIELYHDGYQPLVVTVPADYSGKLVHRYKSKAGNYTTNTTFSVGEPTISGGGLYTLPEAPNLSVREILVNPKNCTYGQEAADCYDYIKLRNDDLEPINLSRYRLRSGYSNTNSTASNTTYFNVILLPGETATLTRDKDGKRISFTANDGTVWLEDLYGYQAYDLGVPPYVDSDLSAQSGRSWAYNDKTNQWQWATPAPFQEENDFTPIPKPEKSLSDQTKTLVPCRADQYRSEVTNRCRNTATASVLKPCRQGQYRSQETNRCRSIATAASTLKPCASDQFRNPATNRCKKIASTEDIALADCGEGRERNPATHRCRSVLGASTQTSTLPFPVEETPEGAGRFVGWWTLGLIAIIGAGYGVWEWRTELADTGRKASQLVKGKK